MLQALQWESVIGHTITICLPVMCDCLCRLIRKLVTKPEDFGDAERVYTASRNGKFRVRVVKCWMTSVTVEGSNQQGGVSNKICVAGAK